MITQMHLQAIIERKISEMAKAPISIGSGYAMKDGKLVPVNKAPPHVKMKQRKSKKAKPTRRVKGSQRP